MLVEMRMSRIGRSNPRSQIVPSRPIGVPQWIPAVRKINPRLTNRNIPAVLLQTAEERHLHVQIVLVKLVDHLRLPGRHLVLRNDPPHVPKFRWAAPANPRHLPDPCRLHLIPILFQRNPSHRWLGTHGFQSRPDARGPHHQHHTPQNPSSARPQRHNVISTRHFIDPKISTPERRPL